MLFQADMFQMIADIVGAILNFLKPIVSPIGSWMVDWINVVLQFFPSGPSAIYIYMIIFVILLVAGGLVNSLWPGDRPPKSSKHKFEEIPEQKIKEVDEEYKAVTAGEYMDDEDFEELRDEDEE